MAERYIRMSHKCYEALYTLPMSDGERRVLMLIVRYTVGFHRMDTDFSDRYAAVTLGLTHQRVCQCINRLIEKKFIYIISPGCGPHPRKIGLNYKEISGKFNQHLRQISKDLAANFGAISGKPDLPKKIEENKNKEIKNKETLQATSFSPNRGREPEVSEEEWQRLLAEQWEDEE